MTISDQLGLAIFLLMLIVGLLCVPFKRRKELAITWVAIAIIGYLIDKYVSVVATPVVEIFRWMGLGWCLGLASVVMVIVLWRVDSKENRAIREGSAVAYDRRVATLMRERKYSREKAIEAVERIKAGE
jgi:hypothetical protein